MSLNLLSGAQPFHKSAPNIILIESTEKPKDYLERNCEAIERILTQFGAVLLRGFNIHSLSEFNQFVLTFSSQPLEYIFRSTPRTSLGGRIYTASEYPANRHIPLHNEFSYFHAWPAKIIFFCLIPPETDGETPLANSHKILTHIDPAIIDEFEQKKVEYVRNYIKGVDLSWQEVFQTEDKRKVEQYCRENHIQYEWKEGITELTTRHVNQATILHPITQQKLWFNQAHLFHISALEPGDRAMLCNMLGEHNLTRNAYFGDGSDIPLKYLENIRMAYEREKQIFQWQRSDILILDNRLMAHGRQPYKGERKIAVALV